MAYSPGGRHTSNYRPAFALTRCKKPTTAGSRKSLVGQEMDTILGFSGVVHLWVLLCEGHWAGEF